MNSKIFKCIIFSILIINPLYGMSYYDMVNLVDKANEILREAKPYGGDELVETRNSVFKDLDDTEITRAFAYWMFEKTDGRLNPSYSLFRLMQADPKIVLDVNEIRHMLSTENDPRRFYCLSDLALDETRRNGEDFIPQKFRMLFAKGLIGEGLDKIEMPYSPEISGVTYTFILWDLKNLGRTFDEKEMLPHGGNIPYEQKIPILAKWLKANWPGCENLEIPADALKPKEATRPDLRSAVRDNSGEAQGHLPDEPDAKTRWPWVAGALALLVAVLAGFKLRKSR